jgi:pimeloyl-ACP methyl ester carboxylesterase
MNIHVSNACLISNDNRWKPFITFVASGGYGGALIPYVSQKSTFYDAADTVHAHIAQLKLTPPVLVAHSMSTYMIQKYLESYALSGLVLVNPIPPFSAPAATTKLLKRWQDIHAKRSSPSSTVNYYGVSHMISDISNDEAIIDEGQQEQPFLANMDALHTFLTAPDNADARVNLERGNIPCGEPFLYTGSLAKNGQPTITSASFRDL